MKKFDKNRPFARINSPSANLQPERLDGVGHDRGNRRQQDFQPQNSLLDVLVISQLIALTPSWATTRGLGTDRVARELEAEQELLGVLKRSYQTWTDAPPLPWHTWYDWNFHVEPDPEFQWLRGRGNADTLIKAEPEVVALPPPSGRGELPDFVRKRREAQREAVVQGKTMELEWDAGAFGSAPGAMFSVNSSVRDLAWPMTNSVLWAVGRSIYDGGHEEEAKKAQTDKEIQDELRRRSGGRRAPETREEREEREAARRKEQAKETEEAPRLTRSELHPLKAIATARWEAHRFPGTDHFVPAIQFMFYANRRGGYHDFASLRPLKGDYEFIVDLPPPSGAYLPMDLPIGGTPDFPMNRLVLRQEPLVDFDFERFRNLETAHRMIGGDPRANLVTPTNNPSIVQASTEVLRRFAPRVELLPEGENPKQRQAKITIPLTAFAEENPNVDAYGVLVSIGWFDPDKRQGQDVKKCTITFRELAVENNDHDTFREEWRLKFGVNGRWFQRDFLEVSSNEARALNASVVLHLHKDDLISVSSHGAEVDLVDDVYFREREVQISPRDVDEVDGLEGASSPRLSPRRRTPDWDLEIDGHRAPDGSPLEGSSPVQRAICRRLFDLMFSTFGDQNDPLGIIDPGLGSVAERAERNPRKVSDVIAKVGEGVDEQLELVATATSEVGDSAELVRVHPDLIVEESDVDYRLRYSIRVETQDALR